MSLVWPANTYFEYLEPSLTKHANLDVQEVGPQRAWMMRLGNSCAI